MPRSTRRLLRGPTAPRNSRSSGGNVEVRSECVLPTVDREGSGEVPIEMTTIRSGRETVAALSRLERPERLLTLKDLEIRVVATGQPRELRTTLTVAGSLLAGARPLRVDARGAAEKAD